MIDPSKFVTANVADTCSLWNVLASRLLYAAARAAQVGFCFTQFVLYECLHKPGQVRPERSELQARLSRALGSEELRCCSIDLEDLQDLEVLEARARLSKGELSSIVFARKTQQAIMTDDRKAAKLAGRILPTGNVQSTPHLVAWLYFLGRLGDPDKGRIVAELAGLGRSLQPHLDDAYKEALRCRLAAQTPVLLTPSSSESTSDTRPPIQNGMSSSEIGEYTGSGITKSSSEIPS